MILFLCHLYYQLFQKIYKLYYYTLKLRFSLFLFCYKISYKIIEMINNNDLEFKSLSEIKNN